MGKGYLIVEGHGDGRAALNLVHRTWANLGLSPMLWDNTPIRGVGLHTRLGVMRACELLRSKSQCERALLLRDEDDLCPKERGPETASWVKELKLPFPVAVVLPYREFEAWFLPCAHLMAGMEILDGQAGWLLCVGQLEAQVEGVRDPEIRDMLNRASARLIGVFETIVARLRPGMPPAGVRALAFSLILVMDGMRSFRTINETLTAATMRSVLDRQLRALKPEPADKD